jgi:hypothetical protein
LKANASRKPESPTLKVIQFEDEAKQSCTSIESVKADFEKAIANEEIHGLITPTKKAAICFEPTEIDSLAAELSSGRISLTNISSELSLTVDQVRLVIQYLLKTKQIEGELTFNWFISNTASKKALLHTAQLHKLNHRRKLARKQPQI